MPRAYACCYFLAIIVVFMVLTKPCHSLPGIGPALSKKLSQCGIHCVHDLLFHLPYRYQDRTRITPIQDVRANEWCVVSGVICKTTIVRGKRMMLDCFIEDKTGMMKLRFFHFNKQQAAKLQPQKKLTAFGEVRFFTHHLEMIHPEYRLLSGEETCTVEEHLTPIYPTTQGLSQTRLRQIIQTVFKTYTSELEKLEWLTRKQLQHFHFPPLNDALVYLHNPPPDASLALLESGQHPALQRLAFDELLAQHLSMQFARRDRSRQRAHQMAIDPAQHQALLKRLPYQLTAAQTRVYNEISKDLALSVPMLRLVQGDVGAGKTVVAALAALQVIANGYQVAFMAPTDILTEQHFLTLQQWFNPEGIEVIRLSGKMATKARKEALVRIAKQSRALIVGTHALFQNEVVFNRLGLVIIDEQHRFGVQQRLSLQQKGQCATFTPHQLLMTATPIPRTLSMTHFAYLDMSILDELPPGRTPVITAVIHQDKRQDIITRLKTAIAAGRQAYWVCTLIDESETLQCQAATVTAEQLQQQLPEARIALIHSRLNAKEKEAIMLAFKEGYIQLLVATTVIEVGVDVANASLMIIENAERLGLSQLHQLRGRVGRGNSQAHCLLLYQPPLSMLGMERLGLMRATHDGFLIAEKDLQLRGAGEILGTRQTGYRQFKIAKLPRDEALLTRLEPFANELLHHNPTTAHQLTQRWLGDYKTYLQS